MKSNRSKPLQYLLVTMLSILVFFPSTSIAQIDSNGSYILPAGIFSKHLYLNENNSFVLKDINGESGFGRILYGRWEIQSDTIFLEATKSRRTRGLGKRWILKSLFKHKASETLLLLIQAQKLCEPEAVVCFEQINSAS